MARMVVLIQAFWFLDVTDRQFFAKFLFRVIMSLVPDDTRTYIYLYISQHHPFRDCCVCEELDLRLLHSSAIVFVAHQTACESRHLYRCSVVDSYCCSFSGAGAGAVDGREGAKGFERPRSERVSASL